MKETWGLWDTLPADGPDGAEVFYRATDGDRHDLRCQLWRPAIHMPRWASRLTLEVVDVRVERLHALTEEEARAEGVGTVEAFRAAWDAMYAGKPGLGWGDNPWTWRVEFRPLPTEGGTP